MPTPTVTRATPLARNSSSHPTLGCPPSFFPPEHEININEPRDDEHSDELPGKKYDRYGK
jgi:hypothetical protein